MPRTNCVFSGGGYSGASSGSVPAETVITVTEVLTGYPLLVGWSFDFFTYGGTEITSFTYAVDHDCSFKAWEPIN